MLALLLVCVSGAGTRRGRAAKGPTTAPGQIVVTELQAAVPVNGQIGKDGCDVYTIEVAAGMYLRLSFDKEADLALSITLYKPGGQKLAEQVSRSYGPFHVLLVTEEAGTYRLEVRSLEKSPADKRYELSVGELRAAVAEDRRAAVAARALAEAESLRSQWRAESLRKAIDTYAEVLRLSPQSRRGTEVADTLLNIGEVHFTLGEYDSALESFRKAYAESRSAGDRRGQVKALIKLACVYADQGHNLKALTYSTRALDAVGRVGSLFHVAEGRRTEAQALNMLGEIRYSLGELKKALTLFGDALKLWTAAADRRGEALAHLNLGYTYYDMGDTQAAASHYERSLSLWSELDDPRGSALSRTALGGVYAFRGERQAALNMHGQAADVLRVIGDRQGEAAALNGVGRVYEELNQPETALDDYSRALELYRQIGNRNYEALTECYVGRVYGSLGDRARSLSSYQRSVRLSRSVGDHRIEAYALKGIGRLYGDMGEGRRALARYEEVLKLYRKVGDRRGQAQTLGSIGLLKHAAGEGQRALDFYGQALSLYQAVGDLNGEAATRYDIAREARALNLFDESLAQIRASINTIELLRTRITSYELRSSYFALVHEYYGFYIDLLMHLHERSPSGNFAALALQASESARSRSLLELLTEAKAEIRQGVAAHLLEREQSLQQTLSARAKYQQRLLAGKGAQAEVAEVTREIRQLTAEYEEVQARIREQSPRYAALTQPQVLRLEDIQTKLLDADTVLLEYSLGTEKSYLWVVTQTSLESYELPPRSQIEDEAREVYLSLTARQPVAGESFADRQKRIAEADRRYWQQATSLGRTLLGQAAAGVAGKRLLIVADGALQFIPFESLPAPEAADRAGEPTPLVLSHEIINLPSASTLASLRQEGARPAARKTIAVLADPVFGHDDPRVSPPRATVEPRPTGSPAVDAEHAPVSAEVWGNGRGVRRLPSTQREARAIMRDLPAGECMVATGFDASRSKAMSGELSQYRVVHFATHGVIDTEHPEFSGIVLSQVNANGDPEDGFLQLRDIYNLQLSADLTVLSACSTGLGKEIRGEGVVGLTRGFMYAGSKSVIASLWKVDDDATAELMKHFYEALLKDGQPPPAALRQAKEVMWRQERWRAPFYWAAFVLQGEYRGVIKSTDRPQRLPGKVATSVIILFVLAGSFYAAKRLRRKAVAGKRESSRGVDRGELYAHDGRHNTLP